MTAPEETPELPGSGEPGFSARAYWESRYEGRYGLGRGGVWERRSIDPHNVSTGDRGYSRAEVDEAFRSLHDALSAAGVEVPWPVLSEPFRNQVDMPFNA